MYKISALIEKTCEKLGIIYKSPHHDKILERQKDANKLADIYVQLKEIMASLVEIEEKYPVLKDMIDIDLAELDKVDHDVVIEARKIMSRQARWINEK